ncbi:MAG: copper amine oxidase N-terminal domain-containing protein, partial [Anaerotignum sp.]|nr:copper amine oxidase N-terminal domain-containing protein [Anaerotignum sp.]
EFSIYIPYYSALVTEVHEGYDYDEKAPKANRQNYVDEALLADTEGSINWNFQIINHYCFNNREALADEVKAFFAEYQESLIDQQKAIDKQMKKIYKEDKELAAEKATELGKDLADQVLEVSTAVLDEILEYLAGDQTEPFKLSKSTLKMEPEYDFDRIGGTGLEEEETTVSANKPKNYSVNVDTNKAENGTVVLSKTRVKAGGEVTVTVTPDEGYKLKSLSVLDKNGDKVKVAEKADGRFVFEMPKGGVEVVPVFVSTSAKEEAPVVKAEPKEIVLTINQVVAKVLGETVVNDVAPIIRNGRTVLPARFVVEALGGNIAWDEAAQKVTITKDDTTLEIFINEPFATVNGTPVQLDAPAFIENSRTYLPLRFIAEYLDAEVTWNEAAQTVTIVAE